MMMICNFGVHIIQQTFSCVFFWNVELHSLSFKFNVNMELMEYNVYLTTGNCNYLSLLPLAFLILESEFSNA